MSIQKADPNKPYVETINPDNFTDSQEYQVTAAITASKAYTLANRPAAASGNTSIIIWVVDAPVGERLQFSDGVNWIPIHS